MQKPPLEIEFTKRKPETSLKSLFENVDSNLLEEEKSSTSDKTMIKLRKQMEFYMGDSNLHNDKFLCNLMKQNEKGFINLTIFLNFNKIKKILNEGIEQDIEENIGSLEQNLQKLKKAINSSNLLKMNKIQTKVRRKVLYIQKKSNDNRVIYVENLPDKVTHEVLAKIFSKNGEVLHVSLPKYTETQVPKGFAFIEFKVNYIYINKI